MELIKLVGTLNWVERCEIARMYEGMYGLKIVSEFEKHFHQGDEHKFLEALFKNRYDVWAEKIHDHLGSTDKLIQLVILMTDKDTVLVSEAYFRKFQKSMHDEISNKIGNHDWCRLIRGWIIGNNQQAMEPRQAAELIHHKHDDDTFISVLCNTTHDTYRAIDKAYGEMFPKDHHNTLRKLIEHVFTMKSEFAFLLCHDYMMDPAVAVASLMKKAVKGAGTDDESLIFVTVLFSDYFKG
jgi:hypothetical protein